MIASAVARVRGLPSWQLTLTGALLFLGFLIAAQLAAEGPRIRYTTQERTTLIETATTLQDQQDALQQKILDLRAQLAALEADEPGSEAVVKQLNDALDHARLVGGLVQLTGPGLVFKIEDAEGASVNATDQLVTARDLRALVQELWLAGAEAIAINGERVTTASAVLDVGSAILVNSAYLAPAYQVTAIGPQDLYERVSASASFVDFVRNRVEPYGLRLSFAEGNDLTVPAYAGTIRSQYAQPAASPGAVP